MEQSDYNKMRKNFIREQETLAELGESQLLKRLANFCPPNQLKDDTALLSTLGEKILINTDLLVEEIHFSKLTTSPQDVGWRAIAANLSDLAASGVDKIIGITVGLIAHPDTPWEWVEGVYEGINAALTTFGGKVIGGDCSQGKEKVLAITAIGTLGPLHLHRSNAIPGDYLVTSGPHGLSRLGLSILLSEPLLAKTPLTNRLKEKAIKAHKHPQPRLNALRYLQNCKPEGIEWRAAGTDSSDGLLTAVKNLCESSCCSAILNPKALPKDVEWPIGSQWDTWCLEGGEDFELVLSLPPSWAKAWLKALPQSYLIGVVEAGKPIVKWADSREEIIERSSFKHF